MIIRSAGLQILRVLARAIPKNLRMQLITQLHGFRTLAVDFGQWRSIREKASVDNERNPIPWYTYPAIEYVKRLDVSDKSVFEWGSGNSSLFWAARVEQIVSIEHDSDWFDFVNKGKLPNQEVVHLQEKTEYVGAILSRKRKFDIIVIDGEYRCECSENAVKCLNDAGLIILDNSDWWPRATEILRQHGLIQIDFSGFGPLVGFTTTTSLFLSETFSRAFRFSSPLKPTGGIKQHVDE